MPPISWYSSEAEFVLVPSLLKKKPLNHVSYSNIDNWWKSSSLTHVWIQSSILVAYWICVTVFTAWTKPYNLSPSSEANCDVRIP